MKVTQADIETRRRTWSLFDPDDESAIVPSDVIFIVRGVAGDVTFDDTGAGDNISGVVDNGDGTGTWTITSGDLDVGLYEWWMLATVDAEEIIPRRMAGTMEIRDR